MANIEFIQAEKRFGNAFHLQPLSFEIQEGEILGVMGPNGAGKTTLLRLMWGFLRPDGGSVSVFGLKPHLEQIRVRLRAGYLAENPAYYGGLKPRQFLTFISNFYEAWDWSRANQLLEEFKIKMELPIERLSKGNRSKLALISAIGHRPSVVILDELTAGLDPLIRLEILTLIRKLAKEEGVTVVLASHISDDLDRIADSVLMLESGKVIEHAPVPSLTSQYGLDRLEAIFLNAIGKISQTRDQRN